ncbi:hypothetical protein DWB84_05090 [Saccharophagus sp. K07]|jgi:hypothetical protein|uniref:hypothetical protein n=1 Tax=Saccharophagus sp. K07 TaxID=2283636 RepID=UPI001652454E|nr:hypothetical protein [Saccharophagus sp. K07]MBC6904836.1 hypothetical protein [Saccharophagus sp. K07]
MDRITVADAARSLETLLQILDNAYWEASDIAHKDVIYDIISTLHGEISELAKLSIEDHYMAYEPITAAFRKSHIKLKTLQTNLQHWVLRSSTASHLEQELPAVMQLLNLR